MKGEDNKWDSWRRSARAGELAEMCPRKMMLF